MNSEGGASSCFYYNHFSNCSNHELKMYLLLHDADELDIVIHVTNHHSAKKVLSICAEDISGEGINCRSLSASLRFAHFL